MNTIVESLKALAAKLGGEDKNVETISEAIDEITEVAGGGGGGGGGVMLISCDAVITSGQQTVTLDKTLDEITAAIQSGITPVLKYGELSPVNGSVAYGYLPLLLYVIDPNAGVVSALRFEDLTYDNPTNTFITKWCYVMNGTATLGTFTKAL